MGVNRVLVFDDTGFGFGVPGLHGKELYSLILSEVYEKYFGFRAYRVAPCIANAYKDVMCVRSRQLFLVRVFRDTVLEDKLISLVRSEGIEVIHVNIVNPRYVLPLVRVARRTGAYLVVTVHNWYPVCPTAWKVRLPSLEPCDVRPFSILCVRCLASLYGLGGLASSARSFLAFAASRRLVEEADIVISPSRLLADYIRRELGVRVVHLWNPVPDELLGLKPIGSRGDYAVFVGRLSREKGVEFLPRIVELLKPFRLHVVGSGPYLDALKRGQRADNMVVHGFLDEEEKRRLLARAAVLLVPSIWRELYGYVVAEAFAHATPVVAFDHGGPGELVEASGGGLAARAIDVEEFSEKARMIIEDKDLRNRLGKNAYTFLNKELSPRSYAERLTRILKPLIGGT